MSDVANTLSSSDRHHQHAPPTHTHNIYASQQHGRDVGNCLTMSDTPSDTPAAAAAAATPTDGAAGHLRPRCSVRVGLRRVHSLSIFFVVLRCDPDCERTTTRACVCVCVADGWAESCRSDSMTFVCKGDSSFAAAGCRTLLLSSDSFLRCRRKFAVVGRKRRGGLDDEDTKHATV